MKKRTFLTAGGLAATLLAGSALFLNGENTAQKASLAVGHGDVATLQAAFTGWRDSYERQGGSPQVLKLTLGHSKALSERFTKARGKMEFDLLEGKLAFRAQGLDDGAYDLWLVDNGNEPGNTVRPDTQDNFLRVGGLTAENGKGELRTQFTREGMAGFTMDSVVLTRAGQSPVENVVIAGSPDLLTKLYYSNQIWPIAGLADKTPAARTGASSFDFILPKVAVAADDHGSDLKDVLGEKVALGRHLFHDETFNGNGRTCGTCHRADNNFTIDPNYIAKLPPTDPLFVDVPGLENPTLLRKYGLILTNVDGPGLDVFRSVPHTLSLATTVASENTNPSPPFTPGEFEADNALQGATGWSGDGAPGSGTLREFAIGAVVQHFPKTLNRNSNPADAIADDFRLPTDEELDAIEAYALSLGRSKDYPVYKLTFAEPLTEAGKLLFDTKENPCIDGTAQSGGPSPSPTCGGQPINASNVMVGSTANCNGCHQHAGGRSSTTFANPTRNTGIENMKINPARLVEPALAYDGGFGQGAMSCGPNFDHTCFGDGRFNTTPLIEAADTPPYFHNNSVSTLEEAIASYNNDAFNFSPSAVTSKAHDRRVKLDSSQITAVASFLRAINALENIRVSNRLDNQARQLGSYDTARELARLAIEENQDAIHVLKEGKVLGGYAEVLSRLESANYYQSLAQVARAKKQRDGLLQQAIDKKKEARALIASCDENAPRPATVGGSPAGFVYTCAELDAL